MEVWRDAIGVAGRGCLWLLLTPSSCDAAAKKQDSPRIEAIFQRGQP